MDTLHSNQISWNNCSSEQSDMLGNSSKVTITTNMDTSLVTQSTLHESSYWFQMDKFLAYCISAAATAASLQSCLTLCDPIDGSPPGSAIPGILQARTLECTAVSFSNPWKWKVKVKLLSRVRPFTIPWTAAYQAPPPMGFSRQEHWSGVPLPSLLTNLGTSYKWNQAFFGLYLLYIGMHFYG